VIARELSRAHPAHSDGDVIRCGSYDSVLRLFRSGCGGLCGTSVKRAERVGKLEGVANRPSLQTAVLKASPAIYFVINYKRRRAGLTSNTALTYIVHDSR